MRQMLHMKRQNAYPRVRYGELTEILPVVVGTRRKRFGARIDVSGGRFSCHPWLGGTTGEGYGIFQGSIAYRGYSFLAHRITWALDHGREPNEWIVRHSCDNPACCNPRHLLIGDQLDNVRDMIERGRANFWGARGRSGADANAADYSWDDRLEAERLRFEERWAIADIAVKIGCHRATVMRWLAPTLRQC